MSRRSTKQIDPATAAFRAGEGALDHHPLFSPLSQRAKINRSEFQNSCPADGWAVVLSSGVIHVHPKRRGEKEEWMYVLAHCLLHLGFGHFQKRARPDLWNLACDAFVSRFLEDLKLGRRPDDIYAVGEDLPASTENALYDLFFERGVPETLRGLGTAGPGAADLLLVTERFRGKPEDWADLLGQGLRGAVTQAVDVAGGAVASLRSTRKVLTLPQRVRSWFLASYPLLGAFAANFELIEDAEICKHWGIHVAAVDAEAREIYFNPLIGLNFQECQFVMAHEFLHVGLRHQARGQGRDPYIWNLACDYVINDWLIQMGIGKPPAIGLLHDPQLKGLSAEVVYDRIVTDLRRLRKLATFRGTGECDMLPGRNARWWETGLGLELDELYRRCLTQGLFAHQEQCRGFLPAGLVQEIQALSQPPIPWDVELAQWFDHHFPPRERRRTYARPSRRQAATPDIPRPRLIPREDDALRTFAVVLDTSGSMDRLILGKALGAIASYSIARDVEAVRLIFCDAAPYDEGYVSPETIAGRVRVKGRGGTVLQPGLDLLDQAPDFPKTGPVLIITDGACDVLRVRREHGFLIPAGGGLPFPPRGPVFRVR
ncbi:MAG TPA: peptidase [Thermoanaerobaculia bacterium]|nr:peptidase [Thermoanaerobaculia bacterium]